jgi:hypothetical protein
VTEAETLIAIEAIRLLKARYFLGIDTRDAQVLRSVFTEDAVTDFRSESPDRDPALRQRDPDLFVRNTLAVLDGTVTAHAGSLAEIVIDTPDTAHGRWSMTDRIWVEDSARSPLPFRELQGWGWYHETYRRTADGWRIASTRLERIKVMVTG